MEEVAFYITQGNPADKHSQESVATVASFQTPQQYSAFRQADCPRHGSAITGFGPGERLFTASASKALINVYSWGKEGIDQRLPVPEPLSCLSLVSHPHNDTSATSTSGNLPQFRLPWLLAAGTKTGRIYIWELASGNLLCVKDAHYQGISVLKFSSCGTFLVSGGDDARCMVWRTTDLISVYSKVDSGTTKPFATFTDHSLPVTDIMISETSILTDMKLYTASRDNTLRLYDIMSHKNLSTFVLPSGIECITKDPANRALYAGLLNGTIRTIPLYHINPNTSVLESVGGNSKIVTLDHDPNLVNTFVHHQQSVSATTLHTSLNKSKKQEQPESIAVTQLAISMDGTNLISGDSAGRVCVSDIVTRQVIKTFPPCNSAISYIKVAAVPASTISNNMQSTNSEKKHRLIPSLKRVLASGQVQEHVLNLEIPSLSESQDQSFDSWLHGKAQEELQFKNITNVNSSVTITPSLSTNNNSSTADAEKLRDLEEKLAKVSSAYTDLRSKHEELYNEHAKLINES